MHPPHRLTVVTGLLLSASLSAQGTPAARDEMHQLHQLRETPVMQHEFLTALVGSWEGSARTWFEAGVLADESPVAGTFRPLLGGRFVRHEYTGMIQGKPRHGEETMAFNSVTRRFELSWMDDFHMNYAILFSQGEPTVRGFVVSGMYDVAADTPAWGWKTVYERIDDTTLVITAYNVSPEGQEAKAVETSYRRLTAAVPRER